LAIQLFTTPHPALHRVAGAPSAPLSGCSGASETGRQVAADLPEPPKSQGSRLWQRRSLHQSETNRNRPGNISKQVQGPPWRPPGGLETIEISYPSRHSDRHSSLKLD